MTNIDAKEMTIQTLTKEIDDLKVHYTHSIDNDNNNTNHNIYVIISGEDRFPDQAHRRLEQRAASGALNK